MYGVHENPPALYKATMDRMTAKSGLRCELIKGRIQSHDARLA